MALALTYNTEKVKTPPTSWDDLWKPEYKGHVVLPDINACCGHLLMLKLAAMNGGGIDKVDPGFKKLATLKPNVLTFWSSHDQMANMLNNGDAWIGVWASDRAGTQVLQGAPVGLAYPQDGTVLFGNGIGMVKGTKHKALAEKYVNFALDAAQQTNFHANAVLGPTNKNVKLPDNVQKLMPSGKALDELVHPRLGEDREVHVGVDGAVAARDHLEVSAGRANGGGVAPPRRPPAVVVPAWWPPAPTRPPPR